MLGLKKKPQASNNANPTVQSTTTSSTASTNITTTLSTLTHTTESSTYSAAKITNYDFLDKLLKCLNALIEIATQSNRNVIIDQVLESRRSFLFLSFLVSSSRFCLIAEPVRVDEASPDEILQPLRQAASCGHHAGQRGLQTANRSNGAQRQQGHVHELSEQLER